jgi:hypothetical protein
MYGSAVRHLLATARHLPSVATLANEVS